MGIELRWVVPPHTTTKPVVLQYRECDQYKHCGEWRVVPTVVLPDAPKPGESKEA